MTVKKKEDSLTMEDKLKAALVPEDEQPHPIPENWVWTYLLSGTAECLDQFREPVNADERALRQGSVPYYGATGQVGWIDDYLTDEQLVLLGEDGAPFLESSKAKAYMIEGKAWVNNHAHILRSFYGSAGNIFLLHYLNQFDYSKFVSGTTRLKLTQAAIRRMPVPLPPLPEQQRIADKLESLLGKIKEAKALLDEIPEILQNFRQIVLAAACSGRLTEDWRTENQDIIEGKKISKVNESVSAPTDTPLYQIPNNWAWKKMGDICTIITGKTPPTANPKYTESDDLPFITPAAFNMGDRLSYSERYVSNAAVKVAPLIPANSVLLTSIGATLGKVAFLEVPAVVNQQINALIPRDIEAVYIFRWTCSQSFQKTMWAKSSATTLPIINKSRCEQLPIPVPPLSEQQEIVCRVESLFSKVDDLEAQYKDAMELIETMPEIILSKAFRGKLLPQDPNDKPAIKLLEWIIKEQSIPKIADVFIKEVVVAKEKVTVKKRIPLMDVLREANGWISSYDLLRKAGYPVDADPDTIEDFYLKLKEEMKAASARIQRERRENIDYFKAI